MAAQMSVGPTSRCCHAPRLSVAPVCVARNSPQRRQPAAKQEQKVTLPAATAAIAAASMAILPAAQAASETMQLAAGEPFIVQAGWAATAAVFSFSLALVVWGRSGL